MSAPKRGHRKRAPKKTRTPAQRKKGSMVSPCQSGHHPVTRRIGNRCGLCGEVV